MTAPLIATTYADADQLAAWFANARPGQRCVYARGCGLRQDNPAVVMTARWREGGDALTMQNKLGNADFEYIVSKCQSRGDVQAEVPKRRDAKAMAFAGTPAGDLLDYIRGLIDDGLPMPTNRAIAEELRWRDNEQVRYRLRQLQLAGLVEVTVGKAEERIVTLLTTGRSTASVEAPSSRERVRA